MINSAGGENNQGTSKSIQMALKRVLQQLNLQGVFGISISEGDNVYDFQDQIIPTPTTNTKKHWNTNMAEEIGHALLVS